MVIWGPRLDKKTAKPSGGLFCLVPSVFILLRAFSVQCLLGVHRDIGRSVRLRVIGAAHVLERHPLELCLECLGLPMDGKQLRMADSLASLHLAYEELGV